MLDLVEGLLLPVESLDTRDVESVTDQVGLDRHVQRRVAGKGWGKVNLKQPRL